MCRKSIIHALISKLNQSSNLTLFVVDLSITFIHIILRGLLRQQYRLLASQPTLTISDGYGCMDEAPDLCIIWKSINKDQFCQVNYFINLCLF